VIGALGQLRGGLIEKSGVPHQRPSMTSVGELKIRRRCVRRYFKHLICFGAQEIARVDPKGIEPLRTLPLPVSVRVQEEVARIAPQLCRRDPARSGATLCALLSKEAICSGRAA
jgi:hypothetical protein